jgi:hypothetical protein
MSARHPDSGTPARDARDWIDQTIEVASGATAVGMFTYGFALSYSVLHAIATAAGLPPWAADMWPFGYETFMASAALNALAEQRRRRHLSEWWQRVPWYPWVLTGLTAGASLLLNWFHPAIPLDPPPGWLRSLVYGLPPLVAVFAWHLFLQRIAHRRPAAAQPGAAELLRREADDRPVPVPGDSAKDATQTVPAPGPAAPPVPARDPAEAEPIAVPVPAAGDRTGPAPTRPQRRRSRPPRTGTGTSPAVSAELVDRAVAVARSFQAEQGRPISRDALGRALHVGNRAAGQLLRAVRATPPPAGDDPAPVPVPRDGEADPTGAVPAPVPGPAVLPVPAPDLVEVEPAPGPVAVSDGPVGNGTRPRRATPPPPLRPRPRPAPPPPRTSPRRQP